MAIVKWIRLEWDRVGAWVLVTAGVAALILGWVGVSGTVYTADQLPYLISGGVGGLFLLGVGAMFWLSADMRDEWRKLDEIQQELRERPLGPAVQSTPMAMVGRSGNLVEFQDVEGARYSLASDGDR